MTWNEAKTKYNPYRVYFEVSKADVLRLPHKQNGGVITCLPINQGFSTARLDKTILRLGYSSMSGPKAYRLAETLDSVGIRYVLKAMCPGLVRIILLDTMNT